MADTPNTQSVLFVCLGNICRSPAAEGVMQHLVNTSNCSGEIMVDSAGTAGYHVGELADSRMRDTAQCRGIELLSRSRKLTRRDLDEFDLVIAMDRQNLSDIQSLHESPQATVRMLSDFLDDAWDDEVPDPYYGGQAGFETVLDMLQAACPGILDELRRG